MKTVTRVWCNESEKGAKYQGSHNLHYYGFCACGYCRCCLQNRVFQTREFFPRAFRIGISSRDGFPEAVEAFSKEVAAINRAVAAHRGTFTKVNLHLDAKGGADNITDKTEMTWSMALETSGDCEVKSWSRKVKRGELVGQMVSYMHKAAREYEEFTKFPDVNQNFQTLYI